MSKVLEITPEIKDEIKKEVVAIAKGEGLNVVEETAVSAVKVGFKVIKVVLPKVSPLLSGVLVPAIEFIEPNILALLDKIDGEDDAGR